MRSSRPTIPQSLGLRSRRGTGQPRQAGRTGRRRGPAVRFASADVGRSEVRENAPPAIPSARRAESRRPQSLGRGRPSEASEGLQLFRGDEGPEGSWTRKVDHIGNPKRWCRHQRDLRRHPARQERADIITYLNGKSDKPAELPKEAAAAAPAPTAPPGRPSHTKHCGHNAAVQRPLWPAPESAGRGRSAGSQPLKNIIG